MIPDLNRLRIFCSVYSCRSVSKAATMLDISQPAVSQQLRKLEKELRIPLFTRANRRIVPTPAAQRLHRHMAPLLSQLQQEVNYIRRPLDTPFGLLRIGAPGSMLDYYLPLICNRFRFRFPTVTFKLHGGNSNNLLSELSKNNLDLALIEQELDCSTKKTAVPFYTHETIFTEDLLMVCSKGYFTRKALFRSGETDVKDLEKCEFLQVFNEQYILPQWFLHHFNRSPSYEFNIVLTANSRQAILTGIRSGMGLGIVPRSLVRSEMESGTIVAISTGKKELAQTFDLARPRNREISLTENAFLSVLKKEFKQYGTQIIQ